MKEEKPKKRRWRLSIDVDQKLHRAIKIAAAHQCLTISEYVLKAILMKIEENDKNV